MPDDTTSTPTEVEQHAEAAVPPEASADADVVKREAGVRLRTNVQAGGASERVNITAEMHARDMGELVTKLESYRQVLGEQVQEARRIAREANDGE